MKWNTKKSQYDVLHGWRQIEKNPKILKNIECGFLILQKKKKKKVPWENDT